MYYSSMNKFTKRTFAETLLLACRLKFPDLMKGNNDLHQNKAAKLFGIAQPNFFRWLKEGALPSDDKIQIIAKKLNITPAQLRGETPIQGIDYKENKINEPLGLYNVTPPNGLITVPLISWVAAGEWNEAIDNLHPGDAEEWRETTAKVSNKAFALRVEGDSMHNPNGSPSIPEGSIIIVDPEMEATSGKIVVAKLNDTNQVTLKKLIIDGPHTYLKPLNPEHSVIKVNGNCTIVGVVKQVIQDL